MVISHLTGAVASANQSDLIIHTKFNGITFNDPVESSTTHYYQYITGADSETGCDIDANLIAWDGAETDLMFDMLPTTATTGANEAARVADLEANIMVNNIVSGSRMDGTIGTYMQSTAIVNSNPSSTAQNALTIYRRDPVDRSAPETDVPQFYMKARIKLPSDLATKLDHTTDDNWLTLFQCKTGGVGGSSAQGDFRIQINILEQGADGNLGWKVVCDNRANHPNLTSNPNLPNGYLIETFWTIPSSGINTDAPVPLGEWFELEWFYQRPADHDDITTGRCYFAMTTQAGDRYVLCDKQGGIMFGDLGCVLTRIYLSMPYCGGTHPVTVECCEFMFRDNIPYAI